MTGDKVRSGWSLRPLQESDMSCLAFHESREGVVRLAPEDDSTHVAVHKIDVPETGLTDAYCSLHAHPAEREINVFLPSPTMQYEVQFGDERICIAEPSVLFVEAGVLHSANAVKGKGWFICIRIPC